MSTMRIAVAVGSMVLASGIWSAAHAQKSSSCQDVQIRWFIFQTATMPDGTSVPSAIRGDGSWYSGGTNSVIHRCGTTPTYDATIVVASRRKVSFVFGAPLTGSVVAETVAAGTYLDSPFFNLRNILCVGCATPSQPFTTHLGSQIRIGSDDYRLRFMPPGVDAPDRHINPDVLPFENSPYQASPVRVIPQPYNCLSGGPLMPAWVVRGTNPSADPNIVPGENLQVGTASRITNTSVTHAGQYSMPFEMRIEALSCFAAY